MLVSRTIRTRSLSNRQGNTLLATLTTGRSDPGLNMFFGGSLHPCYGQGRPSSQSSAARLLD